jgi:hypothetical protein
MITPEAAFWDIPKLIQEIEARLPRGFTLVFGQDSQTYVWVSAIMQGEAKVWTIESVAPNLVLLDTLGWLETKMIDVSSPWAPRKRELGARDLQAAAARFTSDSLPDLDPTEIDVVYGSNSKK